MKRKTASFTGSRPIFSGSPAIVPGGFNLDVVNQHFAIGDVIPAGTLAIVDEEKRKVRVIKTAKVLGVDAEDSTKVSLYVDEFYAPCFAVGESLLPVASIDGETEFADAPTITTIVKQGNSYVITLSAAITGLAADDVLESVVSDTDGVAIEVGSANAVTIADIEVSEFETSVDVSADTLQYALFERRVAPIPASQKTANGAFLLANPHIKLTKSL